MNESSVIIDFNKTEIMEAYYKEKPLDYTVLHQWLRLHFGRAHRCENLNAQNLLKNSIGLKSKDVNMNLNAKIL